QKHLFCRIIFQPSPDIHGDVTQQSQAATPMPTSAGISVRFLVLMQSTQFPCKLSVLNKWISSAPNSEVKTVLSDASRRSGGISPVSGSLPGPADIQPSSPSYRTPLGYLLLIRHLNPSWYSAITIKSLGTS